MYEYSTYVGMDVHARSITCRAVVIETGEERAKTFANCPTAADVAEWVGELPAPAYCAYESGCTGFNLARGLRALGVDCDIIAVSTLAKSDKQKKNKNDKHDAKAILAAITNRSPDHTLVWVPDLETEHARDLARMCDDAVQALKRSKQQLLAFLLRRGHVWSEKTPTGKPKKTWGGDFMRWLDAIEFDDECAQKTLELYKNAVEANMDLADRAKKAVLAEAAKPRWKPYVDAISALKGIDATTAFLAAAEFGDFDRFGSGRKVSAWLGTAPKDNSSGPKGRTAA